METVPEFFGSKVFDDRVMKARLSADVYNSLKKTIQEGSELDLSVANPWLLPCAPGQWKTELPISLTGSSR